MSWLNSLHRAFIVQCAADDSVHIRSRRSVRSVVRLCPPDICRTLWVCHRPHRSWYLSAHRRCFLSLARSHKRYNVHHEQYYSHKFCTPEALELMTYAQVTLVCFSALCEANTFNPSESIDSEWSIDVCSVSISTYYTFEILLWLLFLFLPRCMKCRRGLSMRILSVRLPNPCTVTKRKKYLSRFLYHTKEHLV